MREAHVNAEALQDYSRCPQEYAYRWLYRIAEPAQTRSQLGARALHRTILVLARLAMEGQVVSVDKAQMIWQLHVANTQIDGDVRWDLRGREAALRFHSLLSSGLCPTGIGAPFVVPIEVRKDVVVEIHLDVDFTADFHGKSIAVQLEGPTTGTLINEIGGLLPLPWHRYHTSSGVLMPLPEVNKTPGLPLKTKIWQLYRGMARDIVWANKDRRCTSCVFRDVCNPADAELPRLRSAHQRKLVRNRIKTERACQITSATR